MIHLLLYALLAPLNVVELVDSSAQEVSIQAILKVPPLGAKDLAKLELLAQAATKGTEVYQRREMLEVTNGQPIQCNVTPDIVRFVVNVPPSNLKAGLGLMDSILRSATLSQENLDAAAQEEVAPDYWSAALNPTASPSIKLTSDEAKQLYGRVFRPERVTLAVGGRFIPGEAQGLWQNRMATWTPSREPRGYFDITPIKPLGRNPGPITTVDFAGASISPGDAALPAKMLALFALGVGKGSSLFRIVREKHAWSYRQEAVLSASASGLTPNLLIACIPADDIPKRVDSIRAELLDDIVAWTPASRDRAQGMARAVFALDVPLSPLYLLCDTPVGNSLEDRTFLAGYWTMKTGKPWNADALLNSMQQVSLDDLQSQAKTIVSDSKVQILPGS